MSSTCSACLTFNVRSTAHAPLSCFLAHLTRSMHDLRRQTRPCSYQSCMHHHHPSIYVCLIYPLSVLFVHAWSIYSQAIKHGPHSCLHIHSHEWHVLSTTFLTFKKKTIYIQSSAFAFEILTLVINYTTEDFFSNTKSIYLNFYHGNYISLVTFTV